MPHSDSEFDDRVVELANEYLQRYRRGEQPTVSEYADRRPELAEQIREVFPMMLFMEDHAPGRSRERDRAEPGPLPPRLERLGDFRILGEVGRGGMGVVYEAVQESLGRRVALKVLPDHSHLSPRRRERFKQESRSTAMLHHTNIVPVFAVGEEEGMLYYAMQFIRGAGLDEVIEELNRLRPGGQGTVAGTARAHDNTAVSAAAQSLWIDRGRRRNRDERSARRRPADDSAQSGDRSGTAGDDSSASKIDGLASNTPAARARRGARRSASGSASVRDSSIGSAVCLPGQSSDSALSETDNQYWQSLARIGVQVAEALDYAHDKGTLHRDIKPSNLLLDQQATVWVTDFGLAKSLEQTDLTHTGELIGTLRYMPPEQFSGDADERSDIYSLGLTLYELLTLRPAFDMANRNRLIRAITDAQPPRPRKLNKHIPRDLETIVLKAIDREPSHRYQTAGDLAADLNRFLNNEPVRARPISATERFAKWARRRPGVAALSMSLLISLVLGIVGSTWQWRRAVAAHQNTAQALARESDAHATTKAARREADAARTEATRQAALAEQIAVFLASQFKGTDMIGTATYLDDADPTIDGNQTELEILDRAAERVTTELTAVPHIQARLMDTLGVVYFGRGNPAKAERLFEQSLQLRQKAPKIDRELLARSQLNLACTRFLYGDYDDAEDLLTASLQSRRELLGDDHPHTKLSRFVLTWMRLERDETTEDLEEFERLVRDVTRLRQSRFGPANRDLAFGLGYAAMHHHRKQDLNRAARLLYEAASILPQDGFAAEYFMNAGATWYKVYLNEPQAVPELCRQISKKLREDFGSAALVGLFFAEMGKESRLMGRRGIAELLFQQAAIDLNESLGRCPRTARVLSMYGDALLQRDAQAEGQAILHEARAMFAESLGEQHPETTAVAQRLAELPQHWKNALEVGEADAPPAAEIVATLLSRAPTQVDAAYGGGVQLVDDGDGPALMTGNADYIVAPHIPFDKFKAFTIELWVKNWEGFLVHQGGFQETGVQFTSAAGALYSGDADHGFRYTKIHQFSFGERKTGRWRHLALVFDGQRLSTFQDGKLCQAIPLKGRMPGPLNGRRNFWIGKHPDPQSMSHGLIRAVRVSSSARYLQDFSVKKALPSDEDTVLLYDFTQPAGQVKGSVIPDLSGKDNDGVVQNAWWLN